MWGEKRVLGKRDSEEVSRAKGAGTRKHRMSELFGPSAL